MQVDIVHLDRGFIHTRFMFPVILDILKLWTRSYGHDASVSICTENSIDYNTRAKIAVFCVFTHVAPMVYKACAELRKRGVVTILGGPHFTSDDAIAEGARHGDVVVHSVHAGQWRDLLDRVDSGDIFPGCGQVEVVRDEENLFDFPDNFYKAYKEKRYLEFPLLFTSLGCPFSCEFCTPFMGGRYRTRDISVIVREIKAIKAKGIIIADATFGLRKKHTLALMKAVAPLKKKYFIETTLSRLDDDELLDAFAEGGVKWVAVGIESLGLAAKKHGASGTIERTKRIIEKLTERKILVQGNFICGLDTDDPAGFDDIHEFYLDSELGTIYADLMVPFPSSQLYARLEADGRIFDRDWRHFDFEHVVYKPANMTAVELFDKYIDVYKKLTSLPTLLGKTLQLLKQTGITQASYSMAAWNLTKTLEARGRIHRLKQNREVAERLQIDHELWGKRLQKEYSEDNVIPLVRRPA